MTGKERMAERRRYWANPEKFRTKARNAGRIRKQKAREAKIAALLTAEVRKISRFPRFLFRSDGQIIGLRLRLLKGQRVNGYRKVGLSGFGQHFVHRLICEAFHGPAPSKWHQAAHNDGNRENDAAANLTWKTGRENELDKRRHGTAPVGERNGFTTLTERRVLEIRKDRLAGASFGRLAKIHGVSRSTVFNVCTGVTWGHL